MNFYHAKRNIMVILVALQGGIVGGINNAYAAQVSAHNNSVHAAVIGPAHPAVRSNKQSTCPEQEPGYVHVAPPLTPKRTCVATKKPQKEPERGKSNKTARVAQGEGKKKPSLTVADRPRKTSALNFGWPIQGKIAKRFSPAHNKGIDIAGRVGQAVSAAEAGQVVYGGQGLMGFGKLLIIKHSQGYMTAYANNSRLLAHEGVVVQKGQVIAELGNIGRKRTALHFEIRKNKKPVNPLKLLPKR